jgi:hypothetical protein
MGLISTNNVQCKYLLSSTFYVHTLDFLHGQPLDMISVFLVVVHSPSILRPPVASRVDPAGDLATPCSRPHASATRGGMNCRWKVSIQTHIHYCQNIDISPQDFVRLQDSVHSRKNGKYLVYDKSGAHVLTRLSIPA